jgi:predicted  nucleic acid-binding Zn-ribbon protein
MGDVAVEIMDSADTQMDEDSAAAMSDDDEMMSDPNDTSMAESDEEMMSAGDGEMDDHSADDDMGMAEVVMVVTPDWFSASLTDVHTGETFTVADFEGQVVLVETLAMWCSNCFKQQGQVQVLHDLLGERDDFVSLGVDIDPNENSEALQVYTGQNGFDWLYTVAPIPVAREIGQLYGDQFLNPPSTPMLIVDRRGEVHTLPFGIKSAVDLLAALQPFLDAEM